MKPGLDRTRTDRTGPDSGDHKHLTSKTPIFSFLKIYFGTITDMQHKYCGNCYDIYVIQNQYEGNHKRGGAGKGRGTSFVVAARGRHLCILALNKAHIVAVTTIRVLHVGTGPKIDSQGRETTRLVSGVFVISQVCAMTHKFVL